MNDFDKKVRSAQIYFHIKTTFSKTSSYIKYYTFGYRVQIDQVPIHSLLMDSRIFVYCYHFANVNEFDYEPNL